MTNPSPFSVQPLEMRYNTPLIIIDVFVECLREHFGSFNAHDPALTKWAWSSDDKTTKIFIESGFTVNSEVRGKRPGIWIDRAQNVYGKVTVGPYDDVPTSIRQRVDMFYCMGDTDMVIDCTSPNRGESMEIGSIVQEFIYMTSRPIMEVFALRDISPTILSRTEPFEKERDLWNSSVQFRVNYEVRWATVPIAPKLNDIKLRLTDADAPTGP